MRDGRTGLGGCANGVREQTRLSRRDSGGEEKGMVPRVDGGVADLRGEGIEFLVRAEHCVIFRPSILRKVMKMEHEWHAAFGKGGHQTGKMGILSQCRVVEMPAGWLLLQELSGDLKESSGKGGVVRSRWFSVALIVEGWDDGYGKSPGLLGRAACQNDVSNSCLGKGLGLAF